MNFAHASATPFAPYVAVVQFHKQNGWYARSYVDRVSDYESDRGPTCQGALYCIIEEVMPATILLVEDNPLARRNMMLFFKTTVMKFRKRNAEKKLLN